MHWQATKQYQGHGSPSFFSGMGCSASRPIPILGVEDVPGCTDQDSRMMAGWSTPSTWDSTLSWHPMGHPIGI